MRQCAAMTPYRSATLVKFGRAERPAHELGFGGTVGYRRRVSGNPLERVDAIACAACLGPT